MDVRTLRVIVGRASMLCLLVVHTADIPGFGALPALGTRCQTLAAAFGLMLFLCC